MIYIISDIHGQYRRYQKMLEKIGFSDEDRLYVLGDVIDRGPESFEILFDLMERENVELFLGNHEHMMLTYLEGSDRVSWFFDANGGRITWEKFMELDEETKNKVLDYLYDTTVMKNLDINGHRYILSHTSALIDHEDMYTKDYKDDLMEIQGIVWNQYPFDIDSLSYYDKTGEEITLISGHIITRRLHDSDDVFIKDFKNGYTWMDIDCGCAMGDDLGQLACIAINDDGEIEETYYVE
ncbi:MAG: fructose-bisphosphatase class III [Erysipelotrichaceae bacterium]|nr:fructose-bisphosphatase class III [Erysipelotrichaceae bacterium]MBR5755327.1 fructose-bisphosphatase class III [Erysipelotrichaceae bacterium]